MGYYTDYTLTVEVDMNASLNLESNKDQEQAIIKAIYELFPDKYDELRQFVHVDRDTEEAKLINSSGETMKWYEHEEHMRTLSARCGDILFQLHGVGEEGDHWIKYFMNGRMQVCVGKMVYPDFDPEKLK
jgi:hypothetical protein